MTEVTTQDIEWSRNHFAMLHDGGVWGVPRSGLMFRKDGDKLILVECMPWFTGMDLTPAELAEYQAEDFECIKARFEAAGISVERDPFNEGSDK